MKKTLIFVIVGIFLLSSLSAMTLDNSKVYNPLAKEVLVKNSFGFGDEVAKIKLNTPLEVVVPVGQGRKVAEFNLTYFLDKNGWLDKMEFYDMKQNMKKINRNFDYKLKEIQKVKVNDYETICYSSLKEKGNSSQICEQKVVGSHYEDKVIWKEFSKEDLQKGKTYTIGLFVDVYKRDKIEWIPNYFGVEINEWALWVGSDAPIAYYKLDKTSGVVVDELGNYNGTNNGATRGVTGKINNSFQFVNADNDYVDTNHIFDMENALTWSVWFNTGTTYNYILSQSYGGADTGGYSLKDDGSGYFGFIKGSGSGSSTILSTTKNLKDNSWHYVAVTYDGISTWKFYIDGVLEDTATHTGSNTHNREMWFGRRPDGSTISFEGKIDEIGIWNRTLNSTEIADLYNNGDGLSYKNGLYVDLNFPEEGYPSNSTTINFNCSIKSDLGISKVYLILNSKINETNSSGINNVNYIFTKTLNEGNLNWTCGAEDIQGFYLNATTRSLLIDITKPLINVESPRGIYNSSAEGNTEILNVTFIDTNVDSCWYNYGGTNITINGCVSGVKNSTTFNLKNYGNLHNMTIYANDTAGKINLTFIEWGYKIFGIGENYSSSTIEGNTETFTINVSINPSYQISTAKLIYDGVPYSSTFSKSGNEYFISKELDVPKVNADENKSFYWSIKLNDDTIYNSTTHNQTILNIDIDDCSSNHYELLNITLYDEISLEPIKGDLEILYTLLKAPSYEVMSVYNLSAKNITNKRICSSINLSGEDLFYLLEARYKSVGYKYAGNDSYNFSTELYHIQKASINSSNTKLFLYPLRTDKSTEFKIIYQDNNYNFVEGAVIQLLRKYISENKYRIVEAPITSSDGTTNLHIDLDANKYKIIVVKDGEVLNIFDNLIFSCDSLLTGDCKQKLLGRINPQNEKNYSIEKDFVYFINTSNSSVIVTFSVPSLAPANVRVQMNQIDQFGNNTLCNNSLTASAGSIICNYDQALGDSYLRVKIFKDNKPVGIHTFLISEGNGMDFLNNNFIIVVIIIFSLTGMALTSPEWIIINAIITLSLSGMLFLVNGLNFVMGLGLLMWLLIAAGILIMKLAKQEDR